MPNEAFEIRNLAREVHKFTVSKDCVETICNKTYTTTIRMD